MPKG